MFMGPILTVAKLQNQIGYLSVECIKKSCRYPVEFYSASKEAISFTGEQMEPETSKYVKQNRLSETSITYFFHIHRT